MIPFKKIVAYTVLFVSLFFFTLFLLNRFEYLMLTGELSRGHETLKNSCGECHTPYKNIFNTCVNCHDEIIRYSLHKTEKGLPCVYCHNSHSAKLKTPDLKQCLSQACHESFSREQKHSLNPELCLKCHPEHKKRRKRATATSLKFSHREHNDPSKRKSYSECVFCHSLMYDGAEISTPLGKKQCKKCHEKIIKEHKKESTFLGNDCYWCHFPKKRELKPSDLMRKLTHAFFRHGDHFAMHCALCHARMSDFTALKEIEVFPLGVKYSFCVKCHPHVPFPDVK